MSEKQKPQAWMLITEQGVCGGIERFRYDAEVKARELGERFSIVPLYYEIPKQEWQGLTDEEVVERANAEYDPENLIDVKVCVAGKGECGVKK